MRILQRYILTELLKVFTFTLSIVTVLLVFVGVFREAQEMNLGPLHILQILPFIVPSLLPFTIPATLLLTVCVVYGRISGDQEITAAKAAGVNVMSLLWPAFLLGAALSLGSLVLTDQVIPWAMSNIRRIAASAIEDIVYDTLESETAFVWPEKGFVISVLGVEGRTLIKPNIRIAPTGGDAITIQAESATMTFDVEAEEVLMDLSQARMSTPDGGGGESKTLRESFPFPYLKKNPKARHLSIRDIRKQSETLNGDKGDLVDERDVKAALALATGDFEGLANLDVSNIHQKTEYNNYKLNRLRTELHSRFALSTSCLFFVLVGSPFSILQAKRQFLTSFLMCFLPILVIYYPTVLLMMNLSKSGTVNPAWAMWVGNVILFSGSWVILKKTLMH